MEELPDSDSDNGFDLLEHATAEQQKASILVFEISRNSANSTIDFKKEIPTEIRIYINPNILNYERIKKNLSFLSQEYPKPVLSVIPISPAFKL